MTTKEEYAERRKAWYAGLRSGRYKQCKEQLRNEGGWCCLAVGEDVRGAEWVLDGADFVLFEGDHLERLNMTKAGRNYYGLLSAGGSHVDYFHSSHLSLPILNDDHDWTFAQIADELEQHPERYFVEGTY